MKQGKKILWQRFAALLLAIALLVSGIQFGTSVSNAEETTSTQMQITGKGYQQQNQTYWLIYANTSINTPLVGDSGSDQVVRGLQVETSFAHGDIYVYAVSEKTGLKIQIMESKTTVQEGDYFIVRAGVATYKSDSSKSIELTQDAIFVFVGGSWQFTECTSMKIEKKNNQHTQTNDWKIYAGTSAQTPLVGNSGDLKTVKGLQVETSFAHGDIYVYSVSGSASLLIQIMGAGANPTKGDYFIVRSGVATYSSNSSVGIELTQDAVFVHDGSVWQFTECTSMKIEKKNSQQTKTDDWKIYAGTSAQTPLVGNSGDLKTVKGLQVETSLAHGDIYVYSVSGSATLLIQIMSAGANPNKGDYFIVHAGLATYSSGNAGIELTQDAMFVHDGSVWQFVSNFSHIKVSIDGPVLPKSDAAQTIGYQCTVNSADVSKIAEIGMLVTLREYVTAGNVTTADMLETIAEGKTQYIKKAAITDADAILEIVNNGTTPGVFFANVGNVPSDYYGARYIVRLYAKDTQGNVYYSGCAENSVISVVKDYLEFCVDNNVSGINDVVSKDADKLVYTAAYNPGVLNDNGAELIQWLNDNVDAIKNKVAEVSATQQ